MNGRRHPVEGRALHQRAKQLAYGVLGMSIVTGAVVVLGAPIKWM